MRATFEDVELWMDLFAFNHLSLISGCLAEKLYDGCVAILEHNATPEDAFPEWAACREAEAIALYNNLTVAHVA
jgi:hypothetical protein